MRTRKISITLAIAALAAAVACGDKKEGPFSPSPVPPTPSPTALSISGTTTLQQLGDKSQLTAIVTLKDGTTQDITALGKWSGGARPGGARPVVSVTRGLLTAVGFGEATISVAYSQMSVTVPVRVAPEGLFLLSGQVREGGFGVPEARVEATLPATTLNTISDYDGFYVVPGGGDVTLRVEKDGYRPEVRRLTVDRDGQADFDIQRISAAGDLRGIWKLVIAASPTCSLPPEAMQREYTARLEETAQGITVQLSGGGGFAGIWEWGFTGAHDGTTVRFKLTADPDDDYSALEQLDSARAVGYSGTAVGTAAATSMVAVLSGKVVVTTLAWPRRTLAECTADDHRLVFVR